MGVSHMYVDCADRLSRTLLTFLPDVAYAHHACGHVPACLSGFLDPHVFAPPRCGLRSTHATERRPRPAAALASARRLVTPDTRRRKLVSASLPNW
eukprot:1721334-Pleurochrysis_carterae.AAC.2